MIGKGHLPRLGVGSGGLLGGGVLKDGQELARDELERRSRQRAKQEQRQCGDLVWHPRSWRVR